MQDLASEFSKKFSGVIPPDPHSGRGRPPPAPNTQPGLWLRAGRKRAPVLGPKTWSPSIFQPWLRPCAWLKDSPRVSSEATVENTAPPPPSPPEINFWLLAWLGLAEVDVCFWRWCRRTVERRWAAARTFQRRERHRSNQRQDLGRHHELSGERGDRHHKGIPYYDISCIVRM